VSDHTKRESVPHDALRHDALRHDALRHDHIAESWSSNAAAWTAVVRGKLIPSREAGTDAAIVQACLARGAGSLLDVGCGEGWLARSLHAHGFSVTGADVSAALIGEARDLGGGTFTVATYADLVANSALVPGPWPTIVCNFALLGDPLHPMLAALRERLAPGGRLLVQTVHSWAARGEWPYRDAWRTETFSVFAVPFPSAMPWYYRTLSSWVHQFSLAGLRVVQLDEPSHPETGAPLSLLFHCEVA
jgi:2-polyprenyl-3-methyl-5-hydroxy-6-metoxy-1,4-benzoquinol methylase